MSTPATNGLDALALVQTERIDMVLLDVMMPGLTGVEVCRQLKNNPSTSLMPVVLVSGSEQRELRIAGLDAGADDFVQKPIDPVELRVRVRSLLRTKHMTDELESAEALFLALSRTIEARDPYTHGHCERLARYATDLGGSLGLPPADLDALHRGGFLHDIGKIAVPDQVLLKAGRLDLAERAVMEAHPVVGEDLCRSVRSLAPVRPIIRYHHERLDGSGYPDRLIGDQIPLLAQITAICDVFDALTTDRP